MWIGVLRPRQLVNVERKIAGVVRAIEDGAYNPSLKGRLTALEADQAAIEAHVAELGEPDRIELHPNAVEIYRGLVDDLAKSLSARETRAEAIDIVRQLVDRVVLEPQPDGGMKAQLYGDLALLMQSDAGETRTANDPGRGGSGSLLSVVAGTGFEPVTFRL